MMRSVGSSRGIDAASTRLKRLTPLVLATLMSIGGPSIAQTSAGPTYADGRIVCPDGSTRDYALSNGAPDAMVMRLACRGAGPAASAAADASMENLPSLRDRGAGGTFRCPDGSTRTYAGDPPSDLAGGMLCSGPADGEGQTPAQQAMDAKNAAAEREAALSGQSGVKAGLEATATSGRPDYLLRFPWVWMAGVVLVLAAVGAVLRRLFGGKK